MDRALITGITGQDGSYLAEFLISKGYEVHGIIRRASTFNTSRIDHIYQDFHNADVRLFLHHGDLNDTGRLTELIYSIQPNEVYHLGAQSHVRVSFDMPIYTAEITGVSTLRLLESLHTSGVKARFYQASSSEMFGDTPPPHSETSPLRPLSPYAAAKVFGLHMARQYRDGYGMFVSNGILFNHESPRRGETFVTRKITRAIARIKAGTQQKVFLGYLESKRDWGYAPEYVEAMWQILQHDRPDDYVIGTGNSNSVQEFLEHAFEYAGLDWRDHVETDPRYYRPLEVPHLQANASKARAELGWEPKTDVRHLIEIMVDADMDVIGVESPGKGRAWAFRDGVPWYKWPSPFDPQAVRGDEN